MEYGLVLARVLVLPADDVVYFFRIPILSWVVDDHIDRLEVEAAAVGDAVFGPMIPRPGIRDEPSFIDSNVALP